MDAVVQLCHLLAYHKTIYHIVTAVTGLAIELVNYDYVISAPRSLMLRLQVLQ